MKLQIGGGKRRSGEYYGEKSDGVVVRTMTPQECAIVDCLRVHVILNGLLAAF